MSLSLNCPNCGGEVGECDNSNNYTPVYYKYDKNGQPECTGCGAGENMVNFEGRLYVGMILIGVVLSILAAVL